MQVKILQSGFQSQVTTKWGPAKDVQRHMCFMQVKILQSGFQSQVSTKRGPAEEMQVKSLQSRLESQLNQGTTVLHTSKHLRYEKGKESNSLQKAIKKF